MHRILWRRFSSSRISAVDSPILKSLSRSSLPPLERISSQSLASIIDIPPTRNIDTLGIVNMLEVNGFSKVQSEAILGVMCDMLTEKFKRTANDSVDGFVHKSQADADSSLLKSILHELRLDIQGKSNKNSLELKKVHENAHTELSRLGETLRDLSNQLKTESTMLLNNFKAENREETQKIDSVIHQHNGELTVAMGDFKTDAEGVKLKCIYTFTVALLSLFLMIIIERSLTKTKKQKIKKETRFHQENEESDQLN